MIPELFRIGSFSVSPFGLSMVAAFMAGYFVLLRGLRRLGAGDEEDASAIVVAGGLGGILGAKIYYAILHGDWRLVFDRAGLVWYGGFILGTAAVLWTLRRRKLSLPNVTDAIAPGLALGYAVGRVGCFLVGDDYGAPTDQPWGVAFPQGLPPTTAGSLRMSFGLELPSIPDDTLLRVHPTQLYETAAGILIAWLGWRALRRRRTAGNPALLVLALLAVERFLVEMLRVKDDRFLGPLTLAQGWSLVILAVVGGILWIRRRRGRGMAG